MKNCDCDDSCQNECQNECQKGGAGRSRHRRHDHDEMAMPRDYMLPVTLAVAGVLIIILAVYGIAAAEEPVAVDNTNQPTQEK